MRRIVVGMVLGVLALLAILLINTLLKGVPEAHAVKLAPKDNAPIDANLLAEHLAEIIQLPTVSHQDAPDDRSLLAKLRAVLEKNYPLVHAHLKRELIAGDGLLYEWSPAAADSGDAEPILLLAHQDVVPIEPGTESAWKYPPFSGTIADGYVWGRGAIDDKSSLISLFEALESLLRQGWTPARRIFLASGYDEETGGQAAKAIAAELRRRQLHFEVILDEGAGVTRGLVPGIERPVAMIAVGEKGYVSLEMVAHGDGGHSSAPPKNSSIVLLTHAIDRVTHEAFPPRLLPLVKQSLELMAPELPWVRRVLLSNLWLTERLVLSGLSAGKETSPMIQTTIAPTMLHAGIKDNVLPSTATAVINFRILPGDTADSVLKHVRSVVADSRVSVDKLRHFSSEATRPSSTTGVAYQTLSAAVQREYPKTLVIPGLAYGATDARMFEGMSSAIYRFAPYTLTKEDVPSIHGTNERIAVADLVHEVQVYRTLLRSLAGN